MDQKAEITSPLVRSIAVSDLRRSMAFYRDVLGFDIKQGENGSEAVLGPARIQFIDSKRGPAGSSVLFFQVDDIAAQRQMIQSRGNAPSEIERVNWIKMSMFEVRDPDGNVLWFGQRYHVEDSPSRRGHQAKGLRQALPELPFHDVAAAITYYCDVLGFRINYQQSDLGVMDRDAITILLIPRTEEYKGVGSFGTYVDDVDALWAELSAKGARIQGAPISHAWGLRNFSVLDVEGNRITFSQTFE